MATVRIEKEKHSLVKDIQGTSNAKFYGWVFVDGKRVGTVWVFNDGRYAMNEDFNSRKHSRENRPIQLIANSISGLKNRIREEF